MKTIKIEWNSETSFKVLYVEEELLTTGIFKICLNSKSIQKMPRCIFEDEDHGRKYY